MLKSFATAAPRLRYPHRHFGADRTKEAFIYLFAFVAALARIVAAFESSRALLHIAAAAWVLAFGGFIVFFGPLLMGCPPVWSSRRTTAA
jgi:uncharacterized protein involved in response to NO